MGMSSAERSARYRNKDVDAYREKKAAYARTPEAREKRTAYMRIWRGKNREKHNQQARESHHRNKDKHKEQIIRDYYVSKYGITLDEKHQMIMAQNGCCKICQKPFKSTRTTHVDHCHKTGIIRGILCTVCNTKLGWLEMYTDKINEYLIANET